MKKPKSVIDAEAALIAKIAELAAARDTVSRLEVEHGHAIAADRQAQTDADSALPQCRMVMVGRFSGKDSDMGRVVIVRRTPSGMLVVRGVGDSNGIEYKFKQSKWSTVYRQAEKTGYTGCRQLRDLPAEYDPAQTTGGAK